MSKVPPVPPSEDKLGFTRQRMVGWFDPEQLAATAMKVVLSGVFGTYSDKRELQAALGAPRVWDYSKTRNEIWIDYVADLADGWDSTYTMAYLLSRPELRLPGAHLRQGRDGAPRPGTLARDKTQQRDALPRGRILIMGGDEVYPTPTRDEYRNRLEGPYRAALPHLDRNNPHLFAIPGNHDWYDGLTSFTRLFCQRRWIGAWKTRQNRSYFALKLPAGWWLWGTDLQFEADIDHPQLQYFTNVARKCMSAHERIILCTASPSWVDVGYGDKAAYGNLSYFERSVIHENGRTLAATITGDLHHYSRYEGSDRHQQKITAGGGGAYLYPTHRLPEKLSLPRGDTPKGTDPASEKEEYPRKQVFPDVPTSQRLAQSVFAFPYRNWKFGVMLAVLYLLYAWLIQSASKWLGGTSLVDLLARSEPPVSLGEGLLAFIRALAHAPASVVFTMVIIVGLTLFAKAEQHDAGWRRFARLVGAIHGVAHVLLCFGLIWLCAVLNLRVLPGPQGTADHPLQVILFMIEMMGFGWLAGGGLMGTYLYTSHKWLGMHANELFSARVIEDYKNFLRMHIAPDGALTIYPIGVERVCKSWRLASDRPPGSTWFEPADGVPVEQRARLIEEPVQVKVAAQVAKRVNA